MVPETVQQRIRDTLVAMGPRARGLMSRSLPMCLNYLHDEIVQILEDLPTGPGGPPGMMSRPSAAPGEGRARPSSRGGPTARPSAATGSGRARPSSREDPSRASSGTIAVEDSDTVEVLVEEGNSDDELLLQLSSVLVATTVRYHTIASTFETVLYMDPVETHDGSFLVQTPPRSPSPGADRARDPQPANDNGQASAADEGSETVADTRMGESPDRDRSRSPMPSSPLPLPAETDRWIEAARFQLDLLRNRGGGNLGLVRSFEGLVVNRGVDSYEAYCHPVAQWLHRGVRDPTDGGHAGDVEWAAWVEDLLWTGWVALRRPEEGYPAERRYGIFEAVDGLRVGTRPTGSSWTRPSLRWRQSHRR